MASAFGSCGDKFVTWQETFDSNGNPVVIFTPADGGPTVELCLNPLKGATIDGVPVPAVNGILQLPEDMSGTVVDNGDGTGTVSFPDGTTKDFICAGTVSSVVPNGDGTATITQNDGSVKTDTVCGVQSTVADNGDGTATITQNDGTEKIVVCGPLTDTVVDNGDGTATFTQNDGTTADVCLNPVKSIVDNGDGTWTATNQDGTTVDIVDTAGTVVDNGDGSGTVTFPDGTTCDFVKFPLPPAAESTVVDNGDGTATITQSDGTTKDVLCAGTVSTVVDNGDGTGTVTQTDGTTCDFVKAPLVQSTTVDNGDGTHTITTADGVPTVVCLDPIKTLNGIAPDANGDVTITDVFSTTVDNGDGTFTTTNPDGSTVTWGGDTFAAGASNGDGTATVTFADGSTLTLCEAPCPELVDNGDGTGTVTIGGVSCTFVKGPIDQAEVVDNGDGTGSVTDAAGNVCVFAKGPIVIPPGTVSSMVDNGDGTWTHTNGAGTVETITTGNVTDNGDGTATITFPDGSTKDVLCAGDVSTVVDNNDGTATITQTDGTTKDVVCGPIVYAPFDPAVHVDGNNVDNTIPLPIIPEVNDGAYGVSRPANATDIFLTEANIIDGTADDAAKKQQVCKTSDGFLNVDCPPSVAMDKRALPSVDGDNVYIVGEVITYEYCIQNTGKTDLVVLALEDDKLGTVDVTAILPLAAGAKGVATATYTVLAGDLNPDPALTLNMIQNQATLTGEDENGAPVGAIDSADVLVDCMKCHGLLPSSGNVNAKFESCEGPSIDGVPTNDNTGETWNLTGNFVFEYQGKVFAKTRVQLKNLTDVSPESNGFDYFGGMGVDNINGNNSQDPTNAPCGIFDSASAFIMSLVDPDGTATNNAGLNLPPLADDFQPMVRMLICIESTPANEADFTIEGCESRLSSRTTVNDIDNGSIIHSVSIPWDDESGVAPLVLGQPTISQQNVNLTWFDGLPFSLEVDFTQGGKDASNIYQQFAIREAVSVCTDVDGNIFAAEAACQGVLTDFSNIEVLPK